MIEINQSTKAYKLLVPEKISLHHFNLKQSAQKEFKKRRNRYLSVTNHQALSRLYDYLMLSTC
jgi:hypothetical protein